jgi:hypothetical protein
MTPEQASSYHAGLVLNKVLTKKNSKDNNGEVSSDTPESSAQSESSNSDTFDQLGSEPSVNEMPQTKVISNRCVKPTFPPDPDESVPFEGFSELTLQEQ